MVSVGSFYGKPSVAQLKIEQMIKNKSATSIVQFPSSLNSLFGPSKTWKVFRKQDEAINFAAKRKNDLMTFAFQHTAGERSFLVCHPIVLWYVHSNRPNKDRCSYEVISECLPSKLYLDLEFDYSYNPSHDFKKGVDMVNTIIQALIQFLKETLHVEVNHENFLDLDSSTFKKFSRHVILNMGNNIFANNYVVGNIVKDVCFKIKEFVLSPNNHQFMFGISKEDMSDLFIKDKNGVTKIFVDLAVYSKNRHFRLLGSTKLFKNSPLVESPTNKFKSKFSESHSLFIDSLITHFKESDLSILHYGSAPSTIGLVHSVRKPLKVASGNDALDKFVSQLVGPHGRIRQKLMQDGKLKYEIVGNRFCHNIKREHRSNNIYFVANLETLLMFQLCYDPECKGYVSDGINIPSNVIFSSNDDTLLLETMDFILNDDELMEMINSENDILSCNSSYEDHQPTNDDKTHFPDMNISDNELMNIANFSDYILISDNKNYD